MSRILAEARSCDSKEQRKRPPEAAALRKGTTAYHETTVSRARAAPLSVLSRPQRDTRFGRGAALVGELQFDEVAARYLKRQAAYGRDVRTIGYQVEILRRYFVGRLLTEITPSEIERMIAARIEDGVAQATTNRQRAALSGIFSFAIFEGLIPGPNPVRRVRKFRESQGRTRFLTREESRRLVAVAPAIGP